MIKKVDIKLVSELFNEVLQLRNDLYCYVETKIAVLNTILIQFIYHFQCRKVHRGSDRSLVAQRDAGGRPGPRSHALHLEVLLKGHPSAQVQRATQSGRDLRKDGRSFGAGSQQAS
jgi:hypothetical protein